MKPTMARRVVHPKAFRALRRLRRILVGPFDTDMSFDSGKQQEYRRGIRRERSHMFFRPRRPSLLMFLLLLVGIKVWKKERISEEDKASYREKRKKFRSKLREACAVWDEDETDETQNNVAD